MGTVRLTVVGGGGFRVPLIYRALSSDPPGGPIDEVVLYDVDPGRVDVIRGVCDQLAHKAPNPPRLSRATDLETALTGAAFVFSAIRPGGLAGRVDDERAARAEGLVAQETTGPGGIRFGLRAVPTAVNLANSVATIAPDAWIINFTNPVGMVTEAMAAVVGDRVIGVCDTPATLCRGVARALDVDPEQAWNDYVGLNHLGWLRAVLVQGRNRLPELLADTRRLALLEEGRLFGADRLRALGAIPNEYLWYWYFTELATSIDDGPTRGEFLLRQQSDFYAAAVNEPGRALELWEAALARRESTYLAAERHASGAGQRSLRDAPGGGYEAVALAVVRAIAGNDRSVHILNVRNRSAVPGVAPDAVVEVPCVVDGNGAHPVAIGAVDAHMLDLMASVKAVERLTIEAALDGSPDKAVRAMAMHPMVDSPEKARRLLAR